MSSSPSTPDIRALSFGPVLTPVVQCPSDVATLHAGINALSYRVTNRLPDEATYDFVLNAQRNWPGFPLTGRVILPGFGSKFVTIGVPVPDTSVGSSVLTLYVRRRGDPFTADSCAHVFGASSVSVASFVSISREPGGVHVTWFTSDPSFGAARIERRTETEDWTSVATVLPDASGRIDFEDTGVSVAVRYGYRLVVPRNGGEESTPTVWIDVPSLALALEGATPNPAVRSLRIAFVLPNAAPAAVEVFDVSGRRLAKKEVGGLGPGRHVVDVGDATMMPTGLYLVRLRQGGLERTSRACLIH